VRGRGRAVGTVRRTGFLWWDAFAAPAVNGLVAELLSPASLSAPRFLGHRLDFGPHGTIPYDLASLTPPPKATGTAAWLPGGQLEHLSATENQGPATCCQNDFLRPLRARLVCCLSCSLRALRRCASFPMLLGVTLGPFGPAGARRRIGARLQMIHCVFVFWLQGLRTA